MKFNFEMIFVPLAIMRDNFNILGNCSQYKELAAIP